MKTLLACVLMAVVVVATTTAQKKGTATEAEALVKKAVTFVKVNGKEKAFAEFSDPKGKFVSGELYIFVYDLTGKCLAHGGNAKMVGKDLIDLKDADGKSFVKERVEIAKAKGSGWQNYKWNNPVTKKIEDKTAYIEKVDDVIIGCGAYK
ncbi:MAG TPA: cache domain-containing protein [Bacteroidota bacterium]|nr:cache domain-containing protein [Bacteroidota bacterium]